MSFRALVEKSPAKKTERHEPAPAHLTVAACHREIPRGRNENKRTRQPQILASGGSPPRQPTCPRGLRAEKSPAIETKTIVRVMRRDEGVPPYRRLRRESDTDVISSVSREIPCNRNSTIHTRASQMPTVAHRRGNLPEGNTNKTERYSSKYLPARALCPAITTEVIRL